MADEQTPWNGYPENRDVDGWHLTRRPDVDGSTGYAYFLWLTQPQCWDICDDYLAPDQIIWKSSIQYLGPALTPAEVEAKCAEAYRDGARSMHEAILNAFEDVFDDSGQETSYIQVSKIKTTIAQASAWNRKGVIASSDQGASHESTLRRTAERDEAARAAAETMREAAKDMCRGRANKFREYEHFLAALAAEQLLDLIAALPLPGDAP